LRRGRKFHDLPPSRSQIRIRRSTKVSFSIRERNAESLGNLSYLFCSDVLQGFSGLPERLQCASPRERCVEIFDVHQFEFGVGALLRDLVDSFRHSLAVSIRARASENDRDRDHVINRDRLIRNAHPDGGQAANDIFSPTP
jgi:hypothetical protein